MTASWGVLSPPTVPTSYPLYRTTSRVIFQSLPLKILIAADQPFARFVRIGVSVETTINAAGGGGRLN